MFLQVILWGRTEKCLKDTATEISLSGTECHYFLCDVANREEVYRQAKVLREKVGPPGRSVGGSLDTAGHPLGHRSEERRNNSE